MLAFAIHSLSLSEEKISETNRRNTTPRNGDSNLINVINRMRKNKRGKKLKRFIQRLFISSLFSPAVSLFSRYSIYGLKVIRAKSDFEIFTVQIVLSTSAVLMKS